VKILVRRPGFEPGIAGSGDREVSVMSYDGIHGMSYDKSYDRQAGVPLGWNPFAGLNLDSEVQEFLGWVRDFVSKSYYEKNIKIYVRYLRYLASSARFAQVLATKSPKVRTHILKVVANFTRFLDNKYETTIYSDHYEILKKRLRIKWSIEPLNPRRIPSIDELADIISISSDAYINYGLFIYLLSISGLRPSEARHLEIRDVITPIMKGSSTKRAYYCFVTDNYLKIASMLGLNKIKLSSAGVYMAKRAIRQRYPWFTLYSLRHFFATYMIRKGMAEAKVDFIQGRAPRTILRKHYIHLDEGEALEELYREYKELVKEVDNTLYKIIIRKV
jgi:integrase